MAISRGTNPSMLTKDLPPKKDTEKAGGSRSGCSKQGSQKGNPPHQDTNTIGQKVPHTSTQQLALGRITPLILEEFGDACHKQTFVENEKALLHAIRISLVFSFHVIVKKYDL